MAEVTLIRGEGGRLVGLTDRDDRGYAKFLDRIKALGNSCIKFTWLEPRSGPFHRRHFAMLAAMFEAQEQFHDEEQFRKWGEAGAGFADLVPGPAGNPIAVVKSIAYHRLDQENFAQLHKVVFEFYRSDYARRFLWPHLSDTASWEMVDSILMEFD